MSKTIYKRVTCTVDEIQNVNHVTNNPQEVAIKVIFWVSSFQQHSNPFHIKLTNPNSDFSHACTHLRTNNMEQQKLKPLINTE